MTMHESVNTPAARGAAAVARGRGAADDASLPSSPRTLDELAKLAPEQLSALYAAGSVPEVTDLRGALRGRLLTVHVLPSVARPVLRFLATAPLFPWRGKSFEPRSPSAGRGVNRILSDRLELFPFDTSIGRSRAGAFDALQLDYDKPENPFFIRPIKDEIRGVAPGLWLGQAYLHLAGADHLVLWFALASRP